MAHALSHHILYNMEYSVEVTIVNILPSIFQWIYVFLISTNLLCIVSLCMCVRSFAHPHSYVCLWLSKINTTFFFWMIIIVFIEWVSEWERKKERETEKMGSSIQSIDAVDLKAPFSLPEIIINIHLYSTHIITVISENEVQLILMRDMPPKYKSRT